MNKIVKKVLITGGAGYIGTNIAVKLLQKGFDVVVIDNFSNSNPKYIQSIIKKFDGKIKLYVFDMLDLVKLKNIFETEKLDAVIHLAGKKYVAESFLMSDEYQIQNVYMTKQLLLVMQQYNVNNFVFSSSITVYGIPNNIPVAENEKLAPISPYAQTKADCEKLIFEWQKKTNFDATILRLSNPVGANCDFCIGDDAKNRKYMGVVPYIVSKVQGQEELTFNGNNHQTRDGTTIRDYIHIEDVATAFADAVIYNKNGFNIYNIGFGGDGISVLEILKETEKQLKTKAKYNFGEKREGDIPFLITDTQNAQKNIQFEIKFNLTDMINSQIQFEKNKEKV